MNTKLLGNRFSSCVITKSCVSLNQPYQKA